MSLARGAGLVAAFVCLSTIRAAAAPPHLAPRPVAAVRADAGGHSGSARPGPGSVDLPAIREHLLTQLKRAADAGYVVLRDPSRERPAAPAAKTLSASEPPARETAALRAPGPRTQRPPRLRAAPDDAPPLPVNAGVGAGGLAGSDTPAEDQGTPSCIEDARLSLEQGSDIAEPAGGARPALVGEFDHPIAGAVLAASRRDLRRGLAAEARLTLDSFGATGPDAEALRLMAAVLGRPRPSSGRLFRATDCGSHYRLWQAFERAGIGDFELDPTTDPDVRGAILSEPRSVRGLMAIRLGRAALRAGETETAHWLHDLASRDRDEIDPAWFRLFSAELAHGDGDSDAALRILSETRDATSEPGARALLLMARIALERPDAVARGTLRLREDLGAAERAWRGDPLGGELLIAEARLVAAASSVAEAVSLLHYGASIGLIGTAALDRAVASLASEPGRLETPLAVLYHAHPENFRGALQDPSFRAALARSYASVGIPRLALPLLRASDLADPELIAELSRAAIAAGDQQTAQALRRGVIGGPGERQGLQAPVRGEIPADAVAHAQRGTEDAATGEVDLDPRLEPSSLEAAAAVALEALEDGRTDIPARALAVLKRRKPQFAAALAALASSPLRAGSEVGTGAYLERLDQELSAIGDLLHDG